MFSPLSPSTASFIYQSIPIAFFGLIPTITLSISLSSSFGIAITSLTDLCTHSITYR